MEIASALILAVSPSIVSFIANSFKKSESVERTDNRVAVIRIFVAVLSLVIGGLNAWVTGGPIDENIVSESVNTILFGLVTFIGAHGIYFFDKARKA